MSQPKSTRRRFLKRSAGVLAGAAAVPYVWTSSQAKAESANDRLTVAAIGTSVYTDKWGTAGKQPGRGAVIGHQAGDLGNMVAVADVNRLYAEAFARRYEGKCKMFKDYRWILDRKDVEAVTIGTPDHWHAKIAIDAMRAGKDVYCEKPLTLTIEEGKQIRKVVQQSGRVFQVGTQQRSEYGEVFLRAVAIARSGRLGKKLHALSSVGTALTGGPFPSCAPPENLDWDFWLGQAPKVPYTPERCDYEFRWWLEYSGGQVTDWGVHHTDIALWALGGEETGVVEVEGEGDYPDVPNGYNVTEKFDCTMKLPNGNTIRLYSGENELIISGEKGRIRVNRGGLTGRPVEEINASESDKEWLDREVAKLYRGMPRGLKHQHMANFFHCVKTREKPISDAFSHVNSVNACHMANVAMLLGRKVRFDPEKYAFVGDPEATALMSRKQREPFAIDV